MTPAPSSKQKQWPKWSNMSKRKKAALWVVALSIICGLIIWQVVHWHSTGMYLEMLTWLETGRGYITVLYNLGLMLILGVILGFLTEKMTDLIDYEVGEIKHFDDEAEGNKTK